MRSHCPDDKERGFPWVAAGLLLILGSSFVQLFSTPQAPSFKRHVQFSDGSGTGIPPPNPPSAATDAPPP